MDQNSNYDSVRNARCTGVPFQTVDKSVYWTPPVYYQNQNTKQFTLMPSTFNIYYFFDRNGPGEKVNAFPKGLKMVAGNPARVGYNKTSFADQAVSFVCLDYSGATSNNPAYAERQDINFPDVNACKDGIRYQIFFPQCWDGVNLDMPDHKSHMAYPTTNYNSGSCPSSHPVHTVGIFYEMIIPTDKYHYWGDGAYVLSTGETTGLAFHADFLAGWDVGVLQNAVDNCHDMNGDITKCQVLVPYIDQDAAHACRVDSTVVNESVGFNGAQLPALPGCNVVHNGYQSAPPACSASNAASFAAAVQALPSGWGSVGCIAEGTNGRALTGASTTDPAMTNSKCAQYCSGKGFKYAGVEFGDECYCGNSFSNGASSNTVASDQCSTPCAGNAMYELCGGPQRLTLLQAGAPGSAAPPATSAKPSTPTTTTAVAQSPSTVPAVPSTPAASSNASTTATWVSAGCVSDGPNRALTHSSFTSTTMTTTACQASCASQGFTYAGLEYGTECYCGNSLSNNLGTPLDAGRACYMTCSSGEKCGGTWALSLWKNSAAPHKKRGKHFGRQFHARSNF